MRMCQRPLPFERIIGLILAVGMAAFIFWPCHLDANYLPTKFEARIEAAKMEHLEIEARFFYLLGELKFYCF